MSQFPLQRILDFVRQVVPFDTLDPGELERVVSRMEIAFFPAGEEIIRIGGPPAAFLYIIQSGSAKVTVPASEEQEELLVDIRAEGDCFGALSLLQGSQALFAVTAREDLICYLLPADDFKDLVRRHPSFERHFRFSLARNIRAAREGDRSCQLPQMAGMEAISLDAALVRSTVGELMSKRPLHCLPATPVKAAAHRMSMRKVGSIVVVEEPNIPVGIITDRDLRERVLAAGRDHQTPVAEVMSYPLHTISPDKYAYEALLEMSRHGVHHLAVTSDSRLVGVISDHDLQTLTGTSPVSVVRDIDKVTSIDQLVELHVQIDRVLEMLLRQGGSARAMLELVTEFNDRLTRKLLFLVEEQMDHEGLGRAPVPFCWMALGSEGRKEQTLRTDQDNALVYANIPAGREERVKKWFLDFAERVVEGLVRCGFPRCQGGIMASNPRWCQSERAWQKTFLSWVQNPDPKTLRLASIFFDFRSIYAEADFLDKLAELLGKAIEGNRLFLRHMARNGLYNRPPLGFLRQFVVLKSGEHKDQLNLKLRGLTPMVDGARVLALDQGIRHTNTLDRLEATARAGLLPRDMADDLREAFGFITVLRVKSHLEARSQGNLPDNYVNPASLNKLQRKMLKESFGVISRFQELLEHRYQTWVVS